MILLNLLISLCGSAKDAERSFKIIGDQFYKDGQPFRYVSGSFHYFRADPRKWEEIIAKMKNGGLNAIQTYVAWNLHEPRKGVYNFEGIADIVGFIKLVQQYNMSLILRPGPYICAEWDFGGFPYWLLQENDIRVRTANEVYMYHVREWFSVLFDKVKPYLYQNGGPIIMVQVENEYGFYHECDKTYLNQLVDLTEEKLGKDILLFTVDPPNEGALNCGAIPERIFTTVDFGIGDSWDHFQLQRRYNSGKGPYVNTEFYPGWLDHWEEGHHVVDTESVASSLDQMLSFGASVNFYMYFGGTNFDFYAGANGGSNEYYADPTSYDYDAPLSEAADMTWKYQRVKEVIAKYLPQNVAKNSMKLKDVYNTTKKSYGKVIFTEGISLFDALPTIALREEYSIDIKSHENLDVDFGYVLYETKLKQSGKLEINKVHDRANVFVDRKYVATIARTHEFWPDVTQGKLSILVENQGRINFGSEFFEKKGLVEDVKINGDTIKNWMQYGFNLTNIKNLKFIPKTQKPLPTKVPSFYYGTFNVDQVGDTYLNPTGFYKGVAFVNGRNIGRYWLKGPQLTLYVPECFLHEGKNELIIFECELQQDTIPDMSFDDTPKIDMY